MQVVELVPNPYLYLTQSRLDSYPNSNPVQVGGLRVEGWNGNVGVSSYETPINTPTMQVHTAPMSRAQVVEPHEDGAVVKCGKKGEPRVVVRLCIFPRVAAIRLTNLQRA